MLMTPDGLRRGYGRASKRGAVALGVLRGWLAHVAQDAYASGADAR